MMTEKEIKVLELMGKGLKQEEIAKKLGISQPAVSFFEKSIRKKVGDSIDILNLVEKMKIRYNKKKRVFEF